jgi:polysaccharide deacetylase family protein (PEP-CTERM system associated)
MSARYASPFGRVTNAITVDVEDYFHASAFDRVVPRSAWDDYESRVVANTHRLLDLFDEQNVKGTFFVLGWVAKKFPELVREIAARGHELASHGYHHQLVYMLTPAQFRDDIRRAKGTIEQAGGTRVRGYRAPSFSIVRSSLWALDLLIEEGHTYDASIFPIHHDRYGIADAPRAAHVIQRGSGSIVELPGSTVRIGSTNYPIAGGGYFRLFPYAATKWGISRVNSREGEPVVLYIHPWEVDPDQPRLEASRTTQLRHHAGIATTIDKLRQVTTDFAFGRVVDVLDARARSAAPSTARWAHAK